MAAILKRSCQKGDTKPVPYWRPTDIRRHCTQFSRHIYLATGICAALHITMRHIYVFSLRLCSCLIWRRLKWKGLCSTRRNKELGQNSGRKAWVIGTTSTARTPTGRRCYENGPPKNAIVWYVGFVWSTMGTIAGWRAASLDVVITFLPTSAIAGVWRKAVLRRVVFIMWKVLVEFVHPIAPVEPFLYQLQKLLICVYCRCICTYAASLYILR